MVLPKPDDDLSDPHVLLQRLQGLRQFVAEEGRTLFDTWRPRIRRRPFRISALNLAHYLSLRRHDLRPIQAALMPWGLSSLGRSESRVLPNLDAVIATLGQICQKEATDLPARPPLRAFFRGSRLLQRQIDAVFGPSHCSRQVRIMVTLPTEVATDYQLVKHIVSCGTDCVRINCAHDSVFIWEQMLTNLERARAELGVSCKVLMDLGGPKNRITAVDLPHPKARLFSGDRVLLSASLASESSLDQIRLQCEFPELLPQLTVGAQVWIDDGRLGAEVESIVAGGVLLKVTHTRPKGFRPKPDQGLNFPDTALDLSPLTEKDLTDLDFVAAHADIVGYSFVQTAADVARLQKELRSRQNPSAPPLALMAKIETQTAIDHLPDLIVQASGQQPFAVMIARGDLAVEIGYQRLAEMQEEILWLCEAAHVPVIWATQVLEGLAKKGIPSRAEITDAAMAERADCVMLNKGPFITEAVTILDDVLTRMQSHQLKKTPQLRALKAWSTTALTSEPS